MHNRLYRTTRFAVLAVALLAAACDNPAAPPVATPPASRRAEFRCSADVKARTLQCEAPTPTGARRNLIVGGQGVHVRLASTDVQFLEGDGVFSAQVTVQNLLDQPLGTDGGTVSGVKVFFHDGPTVTTGTGEVAVLNEDGTDAFTGSDQPYFAYPGVIEPRGTSPAKLWEFSISGTVTRFDFLVLVDTPLPAEQSVLHWRLEAGTPQYAGMIWGMWAAAPHQVFAVGDHNTVLHYDGNYWRAFSTGCGCNDLYGVWGTSGSDVWAVGAAGTAQHFDGQAWTPSVDSDLGSEDLGAVWGSSSTDVWAVGTAGTLVRWNGSDWENHTNPDLTTADLYGVWGSAADDVWAVGDGGTLLHWDGAAWSSEAGADPTAFLSSVSGTAANDVWVVGTLGETGEGVALHWDGAEWTASEDSDLAETPLFGVWAEPGGGAWAVGYARLRYENGDWTVVEPAGDDLLWTVSGASPTAVFSGGAPGRIDRWDGVEWRNLALAAPTLFGAWAAGPGSAWAVGEMGTLLRRDGSGWSEAESPTAAALYGVWGSSASSVWAVGEGTILHYGGSGWTEEEGEFASDLYAVGGSSATDVIAVGQGGEIQHYGGAGWSAQASGTTADLYGVWAATASDAFVVGGAGTILRRGPGGAWTPMVSGTASDLYGVWGSGANDVYAVGADGTVLHYDGNVGGVWEPVATPAPAGAGALAVWGSGANDVFVLADDGYTVLHYDGTAWKTMTSFSVEAGIAFYALAGGGPLDVYAVGDHGAIVHGTR